jgi:hydrogenase maturation protease
MSVLVGGIGNIFLGDDAFGSEVARRLLERSWPRDVRIVDFGIRGIDLTFALLDDYETVILIDATRRGGAPGTLYTIEPDLSALDGGAIEPHSMDPVKALAAAKAMGARFRRMYIVGCEPTPETVDEDGPGSMGLSFAVAEAVERAIPIVEGLLERKAIGGTAHG